MSEYPSSVGTSEQTYVHGDHYDQSKRESSNIIHVNQSGGHCNVEFKARGSDGANLSTLEKLNLHIAAECMNDSADRVYAPKCDPETRKVVQDKIFRWISHGEPDKILWLTGPAGAGKSAIMGTVCDKLKAEGNPGANYFFSAYSGLAERKSKRHFVTTLAYQLQKHPRLKDHISVPMLATIREDPAVFKMSLQDQMELLILQPLRRPQGQVAPTPPVVVLVDGVDECGEDQYEDPSHSKEKDQTEVLRLLRQALDSPFRIIVASRPEKWIRAFFDKDAAGKVREVFLDEEYLPDEDIRLFLRRNLDEFSGSLGYPPSAWPRDEDIETLVADASGQFIYAATVLRFIGAPEGPSPQERLDIVLKIKPRETSNPFIALDSLYTSILQSNPRNKEVVLWLKAQQRLEKLVHDSPLLVSAWTTDQLFESHKGQALTLLGLPSLVRKSRSATGTAVDSFSYGKQLKVEASLIPADVGWDARYSFYHKSFLDYLEDPTRCGVTFPEVGNDAVERFVLERCTEVFISGHPKVPIIPPLLLAFQACFLNIWIRIMPPETGIDDGILSKCDPTVWLNALMATPFSDVSSQLPQAIISFPRRMFISVHQTCCLYLPCKPGCKRWRSAISKLPSNKWQDGAGWNSYDLLLDRFCIKRLPHSLDPQAGPVANRPAPARSYAVYAGLKRNRSPSLNRTERPEGSKRSRYFAATAAWLGSIFPFNLWPTDNDAPLVQARAEVERRIPRLGRLDPDGINYDKLSTEDSPSQNRPSLASASGYPPDAPSTPHPPPNGSGATVHAAGTPVDYPSRPHPLGNSSLDNSNSSYAVTELYNPSGIRSRYGSVRHHLHGFPEASSYYYLNSNNSNIVTKSTPFDLVSALNPILDASHTRNRKVSPPNSKCFVNTREAVIAMILSWAKAKMDGEAPHILWMYGYAGCGKSAISQTVAQKLEQEGLLAASFFFFRGAGDRGRLSRFAATVASQLAAAVPETATLIEDAVRDDPALLSTGTASVLSQFQKLVFQPIVKVAASHDHGPYIIVLDGVNECEDREEMATLIEQAIAFFDKHPLIPLRIIAASRVEDHLHRELHWSSQVQLLDLVDHTSDADIATALDVSISRNMRGRKLPFDRPWPGTHDKIRLVQHIGGSYIFMTTIIKLLFDPTRHDGLTPMERLPQILGMKPDFDDLYREILEPCSPFPFFLDVISTLALAFEPISIAQIAELLDIRTFKVTNVLINLQAIIQVPGDDRTPVKVWHSSFRDFLTSMGRAGPFFASPTHYQRLAHGTLRIAASPRCSAQDYSRRFAVHHFAAFMESVEEGMDPFNGEGYTMIAILEQPIFGQGQTALEVACRAKEWKFVRALAKFHAKINARFKGADWDTSVPLHSACHSNAKETVYFLLEKVADPNLTASPSSDPDKWGFYAFPLAWAAAIADVAVVKRLLAHGADLDLRGGRYGSALHVCAYENKHEISRILLEHGANPNIKTEHRSTPIHYASRNGHFEAVECLLEFKADPNVQNEFGDTPLHNACHRGKVEVAELLLNHDANPSVRNTAGKTALQYAEESTITGAKDVADMLRQRGITE